MSKTEYQRISGNTNVKCHCTITDCVNTYNQPLALLTSQMSSVLGQLDTLLDKVNKIDTIMVYNLEESSVGNADARKKHDLDLAISIFSPLIPNFSNNGIKTFRVGGKKPDRSRSLKVVLSSNSDVATAMKNFAGSETQLNPRFSSVKLSRDRTPREAAHLHNLKAELKERTTSGEKDLTIRCDRSLTTRNKISGGGTLIAVRDHLASELVPMHARSSECVFINCISGSRHILLGSVYVPPN
ncbi:hypothetical protein J6590_007215 [Homalodisca vitripennis]|nr:hypothetical protein J6590_007215 [Homalodisca vitripennis]